MVNAKIGDLALTSTLADAAIELSRAGTSRKAPAALSSVANKNWVFSRAVTSPPAAMEGDRYIVPASATGAWVGHQDAIAEWLLDGKGNGAWYFAPPAGFVWLIDEALHVTWKDGTWQHYGIGIAGPPGPTGADGTKLRDGSGVPSNGLGVNGDYYLDDATGNLYLKSAGAYGVVANLKGPTGTTGATGATGAIGADGVAPDIQPKYKIHNSGALTLDWAEKHDFFVTIRGNVAILSEDNIPDNGSSMRIALEQDDVGSHTVTLDPAWVIGNPAPSISTVAMSLSFLQVTKAGGVVTVTAGGPYVPDYNLYLPIVGGILTGNLTIAKPAPTFTLNTEDANQEAAWRIERNGKLRWKLSKDNSAAGGSNTGGDFLFERADDAGNLFSPPVFKVSRATGNIDFNGKVTVIATDAVTNAISYPYKLIHNTTDPGHSLAGFGVGIWQAQLENSTGANTIAGSADLVYESPTNGAEGAYFAINLIKGGVLSQAMRLSSFGFLVLPNARKFTSVQFDKFTQSAATITPPAPSQSLSVFAQAGKTYRLKGRARYSAGAGGQKWSINSNGSATFVEFQIRALDDATKAYVIDAPLTAFGQTTGLTAAGTGVATVEGTVTMGSAGELRFQFGQNATNAAASSVLPGATFEVEEWA